MDLLHLVDRLEELVASAQKMPIGNRAIIDRRRLLDIIDQMRIAIPQEVREAQDIVAHREAIRREAEEEGRILVAQSEERADIVIAPPFVSLSAALDKLSDRGHVELRGVLGLDVAVRVGAVELTDLDVLGLERPEVRRRRRQ